MSLKEKLLGLTGILVLIYGFKMVRYLVRGAWKLLTEKDGAPAEPPDRSSKK